MFNKDDKLNLLNAIDLAIASSKRAKNSSKSPQFTELYDKILQDYRTLRHKIETTPVVK